MCTVTGTRIYIIHMYSTGVILQNLRTPLVADKRSGSSLGMSQDPNLCSGFYLQEKTEPVKRKDDPKNHGKP